MHLEIRSMVSGLSGGLLAAARVVDGLGSIGGAVPGADARRTAQRIASAMRVIEVGLLRGRPARHLETGNLRRAGVGELKTIAAIRAHSFPLAALTDRARTLSTPMIREAAAVCSQEAIEPRASTREATSTIARMPQIRSGEDPALLSLSECENCLREAEATRGIPADDAGVEPAPVLRVRCRPQAKTHAGTRCDGSTQRFHRPGSPGHTQNPVPDRSSVLKAQP
jgi:hypothetical protein